MITYRFCSSCPSLTVCFGVHVPTLISGYGIFTALTKASEFNDIYYLVPNL